MRKSLGEYVWLQTASGVRRPGRGVRPAETTPIEEGDPVVAFCNANADRNTVLLRLRDIDPLITFLTTDNTYRATAVDSAAVEQQYGSEGRCAACSTDEQPPTDCSIFVFTQHRPTKHGPIPSVASIHKPCVSNFCATLEQAWNNGDALLGDEL